MKKWGIALPVLGLVLAVAGITIFRTSAVAATSEGPVGKHPRVAELEDRLTRDATAYLKSRFPENPFIVTASIEPIRRQKEASSSKAGAAGDDILPYMDGNEAVVEIQDEWDDTNVSFAQLMGRVKKASIRISLPDSITDDEIAEVRETTTTLLHLTPERDDVSVQRRAWKSQKPDLSKYVMVFAGVLALSLLVISILNRNALRKLAMATAMKSSEAPAAAAAPLAMSAPMPTQQQDQRGGSGSGGGGGLAGSVEFSDPISTKAHVRELVDEIAAQPAFPTLSDMVELEIFAADNTAALGALLHEFPPEVRMKLFSLGTSHLWFEAYARPGALSSTCVSLMHKLHRVHRDAKDIPLESLLVRVWRMAEEERAKFIRGMDRKEAFFLLDRLPKTIGIPAARRAFPGAWASLLGGEELKPVAADRIHALITAAEAVRPLTDPHKLAVYRRDLELLDFLKVAEPGEEREIYEALNSDSIVFRVRPAFYAVLALSDEILREMAPRFHPEQWALALFNVPRQDRARVEKSFPDKHRFAFMEVLKRLDQTPPSQEAVGTAREGLARSFAKDTKNNRPVQGAAGVIDGTERFGSEKPGKAAILDDKPKTPKAA